MMKRLLELQNTVLNYSTLKHEDTKYSYMIVKPNGEKHFSMIVTLIQSSGVHIEGMYKIDDYEYVNILLHPEKEKQKYIIPINRIYKDYYSNRAILILVSEGNISYEDFSRKIVELKLEIRYKNDYNYIAYVLDVSKIGMRYNGETLKIVNKFNVEVAKQKMNEKGTFLVISINEIHSPDANIENTINELILLFNGKIISKENEIPNDTIEFIMKYGTFSFLQDLS